MSRISKLPPEIIEVPWEPGNRLHLRPLTESKLQDAAAAALAEQQDRYGWTTEQMQAMASNVDEDDPRVKEARRQKGEDTLEGHSALALLRHGLVGCDGERYGAFDKELYSDLDPRTELWAAEQVLRISKIAKGELSGSVAGIASSVPVDGAPPVRELTPAESPS